MKDSIHTSIDPHISSKETVYHRLFLISQVLCLNCAKRFSVFLGRKKCHSQSCFIIVGSWRVLHILLCDTAYHLTFQCSQKPEVARPHCQLRCNSVINRATDQRPLIQLNQLQSALATYSMAPPSKPTTRIVRIDGPLRWYVLLRRDDLHVRHFTKRW